MLMIFVKNRETTVKQSYGIRGSLRGTAGECSNMRLLLPAAITMLSRRSARKFIPAIY